MRHQKIGLGMTVSVAVLSMLLVQGEAVTVAAPNPPVGQRTAVASSSTTDYLQKTGEGATKSAFPGTYYWLPEHARGRCITAHGGVYKGAKADQYMCVGQNNQKWYVVNTGQVQPPLYRIHAASNAGLCLDVPGSNYRKGAQVALWTCHGGINQQFWFICDAGQKHCQIRMAYGPARGKCLSVRGGSKKNNAPLIIWNCKNVKDQKFTFRR